MADTYKTYHQTKFTLNYDDDDTRTVTLDNSKALQQSQAETVRNAIDTYGAITVGDKAGGTFVKSSNCQCIEKVVYELDLNEYTN